MKKLKTFDFSRETNLKGEIDVVLYRRKTRFRQGTDFVNFLSDSLSYLLLFLCHFSSGTEFLISLELRFLSSSVPI